MSVPQIFLKIIFIVCYCIPGPNHVLNPEGVAEFFRSHVINIQNEEQQVALLSTVPNGREKQSGAEMVKVVLNKSVFNRRQG